MKRLWPLAALAILLAAGGRLAQSVRVNAGFLVLNRAMSDAVDPDAGERAEATFRRALAAAPHDRRAMRGMGRVDLAAGRLVEAEAALRAAGWTAAEYAVMADHAVALERMTEAMAWYGLAVNAAPHDGETWAAIGLLCQRDWTLGPLCDEFLTGNGGNRLVNPDFTMPEQMGWSASDAPGTSYTIENCEGDARCGLIDVAAAEANPLAGLYQCLQLEAGRTYRFSAWLQVEADADTVWRALYVQGNVGGEPHGIYGGDRQGAQPWQYEEQTFQAPAFDGLVCFHPVRLQHEGSARFRDAAVSLVGP